MTTAATTAPQSGTSRSASSAYTVVALEADAERANVLRLWQSNPLQPDGADAKYQWFYADNPYGAATRLLRHGGPQGEAVGAAGFVTRQMLMRGVALRAAQLTDFFVLPGHRTLAPALLLQRQMLKAGLETHDVLYGYPNDKSGAIVRRIGYAPIGDFVKFVTLLRYGNYLERWFPRWACGAIGAAVDAVLPLLSRPTLALLGSWHGEWASAPDERIDALWQRASNVDGVIGVRDREFIAWRFFARPDHEYRIFNLARSPGGPLVAYAICEASEDTLHIRDALVDSASPNALRVLIHRLTRLARSEGLSRLSFECLANLSMRRTLRAAGMFERGKTTLVANVGSALKPSMQGLQWYITAADTEV